MKHITTLFLLLTLTTSFAKEYKIETISKITQTNTPQPKSNKLENPFEAKENIGLQFDYLYKKSTTYQEYKVISISLYNTLKSSVLDSIQSQKNIIAEKNGVITDNKQQITSLQEKLTDTQNKLETAISLKESRSILGMPTSKTIFSTVIAVTYITLFILLGFFIFKYKQNLGITNKAVDDLNSLEIEFEKHKKNSLKRFQEVSRKLQDELNKNWKKEK
ncbi:hypothetical protein [Wenyingzhuangia marina]|uniref:tRNA (Guanine-N1)-methyltransferase n=1 Tax=Wenyingzhuangia marina TaxID=1195760 RepID=A0A1M5SJ76_9FLAO|nr:hypothetical protein [Wenyingzhuangia marina]GGF62561.1 hypothetical protein GCM10011397_02060 [Wenyingzhuangia marina]SHH38642.1 hypothetical protein SAMN05444281_0346 [Wenyingzhuangia marina]